MKKAQYGGVERECQSAERWLMEKSPLTISVELPDFIGGGGLCLGGPLERRDNEMFSYNRVAHACYTVNAPI